MSALFLHTCLTSLLVHRTFENGAFCENCLVHLRLFYDLFSIALFSRADLKEALTVLYCFTLR